MDWKPVVEAEMNKLAKIFEKLEPSMGEEIVQRMGGDFNPSDPVYSGWSREELEEERIRKEGVAKDERIFEDHVRQFGEYHLEKADYEEILQHERKIKCEKRIVEEKKEMEGGKGRRAEKKRREKAAKRQSQEVKKDEECFENLRDGSLDRKVKLLEKLSSLEKLEMEEESEISLLQERCGEMNDEVMQLNFEEMELLMEMRRIDEEVAELNARKCVVFERRQQTLKDIEVLDTNFDKSRRALLTLAKKSQGTLKLIKLMKKKLHQTDNKLHKKVLGGGGGDGMIAILEKQIKEMEEELECPVCFEVSKAAPIFKCSDDHLICKECRPKVAECPQCRVVFTETTYKRFRGAEKQAARLVAIIYKIIRNLQLLLLGWSHSLGSCRSTSRIDAWSN